MSGEASLAVAGRLYTKSLAVALSRAGMLAELARAGVEFRRPVADLGCGDGLFARALREVGLLDEVDVALDHGLTSLEALALRPRLGAARGDLAALPFASGSLGTVLCVTVLNALEGGADAVGRALLELRRVLRPGGAAVVVVSTPAFTAEAWPRKALLRLGLPGAAGRFRALAGPAQRPRGGARRGGLGRRVRAGRPAGRGAPVRAVGPAGAAAVL